MALLIPKNDQNTSQIAENSKVGDADLMSGIDDTLDQLQVGQSSTNANRKYTPICYILEDVSPPNQATVSPPPGFHHALASALHPVENEIERAEPQAIESAETNAAAWLPGKLCDIAPCMECFISLNCKNCLTQHNNFYAGLYKLFNF